LGYLPYKVSVNTNALNIRAGAGTNYKIVGYLSRNAIRTIVEEKGDWGKLQNDEGWIKLGYTVRVK
jgi:uncharacterized protein YgiM (DUF1202 family)